MAQGGGLKQKNKKRTTLIAALCAAVLVAAALFALPALSPEREAADTAQIRVARGDLALTESATATTDSGIRLQYAPETPAALEVGEVYVAVGDEVRAGDRLLRLTDESLAAAQSSLQAAKASAQSSLGAEIADGVLRAEYSGTLTAVGFRAGELLSGDVPLAAYSDPQSISLTVRVERSSIFALQVGGEAQVSVSGEERRSATIIGISSGEAVTLSLDNADGALSAGLKATAVFTIETLKSVLYLPDSAIYQGGDGKYVKKVTNGAASRTPVSVGRSNDGFTVITGGLSEGDVCLVAA